MNAGNNRCECRKVHYPAPLDLERHHIWPQGMGGPSTPNNLVWVCPTTHTNTHEILRELMKRNGEMTYPEAMEFWTPAVSRFAFHLAHEGYRRIIARKI